jgi:2-oxoglutarate dehydrogenase E1 component
LRDAQIEAPEAVTRVVLTSGKFYYELLEQRDASRDFDTALVRIEQLYPFPHAELAERLAEFPRLEEIVWAQEEDRNQGAWRFVREELEQVLPAGCRLSHVCRTATASGAHSSVRAHLEEQQRLVAIALG